MAAAVQRRPDVGATPPDQHGVAYSAGYPVHREGDEQLVGRVLTLDDAVVIREAPR